MSLAERTILETERLVLVAATPGLAEAELCGPETLARGLSHRSGRPVKVPGDWPPPLNDEASMRWNLEFLEGGGWEAVGWGLWFFLLKGDAGLEAVGNGGYKGLPDDEGVAEVGYSVMPDYQRRGIAPEAVGALVGWGLKYGALSRIIAHTLPDLTASIRVLEKCGFEGPSPGPEDGVIRYDLIRKA